MVMVLCLVGVMTIPLELIRSHLLLLLILACASSFRIYKRWWPRLLTMLFIVGLFLYVVGGQVMVLTGISDTPLIKHSTPSAPSVEIVPGGDSVHISFFKAQNYAEIPTHVKIVVCFYIPSDEPRLVAAAHSCGLKTGDLAQILPSSEVMAVEPHRHVTILCDCEDGVIFDGLKCPDPNRRALPLASVDEVIVGEEAIISISESTVPVKVLGFGMIGRNHLLVLQTCSEDPGGWKGKSGSPIIQNGKVIAFLHSVSRFHKGKKFVMARPALEIYQAFASYLIP